MDQTKIGSFIASCRKERGLTQAQLAEKLGVSGQAVSKWERGKSLPDASIMLPLCVELHVNANELLSGEKLTMENYNQHAEENLLALKRENEEQAKLLLMIENVLSAVCLISWITLILAAVFINMALAARITLIVAAIVIFVTCCCFAILIEQKAGYYECQECGWLYVPTYKQVLFAMHVGRTRYMTCPKCAKRSWHKKVTAKD